MLRIRLRRVGNKNNAQYRVVVSEHSSPIKGKFIDWVGSYNPHSKTVSLKKELLLAWLNKGAKPSNTVAKLLKKNKISHSNIVVKLNKPRLSKSKTKETSQADSVEKTVAIPKNNTEIMTVNHPEEEMKDKDITDPKLAKIDGPIVNTIEETK